MNNINLKQRKLLENKAVAFASINLDGSPNVIAVEVNKVIEDKIIITDNYMQTSLNNIKKDNRVCLAIWSKDWKEGYKFFGRAEYFTSGKWLELIKSLKDNIGFPAKGAIVIKINKIKIDGSSKLHIISDFDRTITKAFVEGQKTPTSLAQIREGKYLTKDYPEKAHALFDKYHAYEISNTIPKEERDKKMVEWWTAHLELLIKSGMNEGVVKDIIQKKKIF